MEKINWSKLKSGTDIRGTAIKKDDEEIQLTAEVSKTLGQSFITWLDKKINKPQKQLTISVGMDSRLSGTKLKSNLIQGFTEMGVDVYDCGLASTPAMFMSTILSDHEYDGAVMITASHLPYHKNGFKFFTAEGGLEGENIKEILKIAEEKEYSSSVPEKKGKTFSIDLITDYSDYLVKKIKNNLNEEVDQSSPLADFNIVVDAGNGCGGFFVDKILKPLGAKTAGSQFLKPDGNFPHHIPNPEDNEAMQAIKKAVIDNNADLGIIFDTDVDRAAVVDDKGQAINRNKLIALASVIVLEEYPGSTIVTDSVTSRGLTDFIEKKLGGIHHRFKRGYKNVINEALRLNDQGQESHLAIETSGHAAFKENYFLDDGAYLVAKILIKMANLKTENNCRIGELITDLEEPEITKEYRMTIQLENFKKYGQKILQELKFFVKDKSGWQLAPKNYQGVRVNCGEKDWFLLRMSLHDPVLVLNIECENRNKLNSIKTGLNLFLEQFEYVNSEEVLL